jgi:hypothetical protein
LAALLELKVAVVAAVVEEVLIDHGWRGDCCGSSRAELVCRALARSMADRDVMVCV